MNTPTLTPSELHQWRVGHDLTQGELATRLGVTPTSIARWERGEVVIPTILALALKGLSFTHGQLCCCPQCYNRFGTRAGRDPR